MPFILSDLFLIKFEFVTETWFNAGEITWPVFKDKFKSRFLPKKSFAWVTGLTSLYKSARSLPSNYRGV